MKVYVVIEQYVFKGNNKDSKVLRIFTNKNNAISFCSKYNNETLEFLIQQAENDDEVFGYYISYIKEVEVNE